MRQSPIYNIIHNPGRASDCSFGATDRFTQDIRVGTSRTNSHTLGEITVQRNVCDDGAVEFSLWLDGHRIKRGVLHGHEFREIAA